MASWGMILAATFTGTLSAFLWYLSRSKGISFWIRYFITLIYLKSQKNSVPKRLSDFKNLKNKNLSLEDLGLIPSSIEYELEMPQKQQNEKFSDGVHFFGVDASENSLEICVNKLANGQSTVWLILKFSDGKMFQLPSHPDTRAVYTGNEYLFSSSSLQIQCLSPLRRWRIVFNGLLRKCITKDASFNTVAELVHVKFSFVWLTTTIVHDLSIEYEPIELTRAFMAERHHTNQCDMAYFREVENRYEQWGQFMGTVQIENEETERELYLWSVRTRLLDVPPWKTNLHFAKLYIYSKDGIPLKIEAGSIPGFMSNYVNGYMIGGGGEKYPISDCNINLQNFKEGSLPTKLSLSFMKSKKQHNIEVTNVGPEIQLNVGPNHEMTLLLSFLKVQMGEDDAFGVMHWGYRSSHNDIQPLQLPLVILKDKGPVHKQNHRMTLPLNDDLCQSSTIAGGKGLSLSLLTALAKLDDKFIVPKGFVITTTAFEHHIKINRNLSDAVDRLVAVSCERISGNLKEECERCEKEFLVTTLAGTLEEDIKAEMESVFNKQFSSVKFAVRSSAFGEDSEELSAAGQMLTLLGVTGLHNVYSAVSKCWSSHFRFEAVQYFRLFNPNCCHLRVATLVENLFSNSQRFAYRHCLNKCLPWGLYERTDKYFAKRLHDGQNGRPINSPMAVVIQEMVPADTAGVIFTVDPVTGNPSYPCITANFGLGETVVSSLAEPDTIILKRGLNNSLSIWKQNIGSKKIQVTMKEDGETEEQELKDKSATSCLTEDWALKIGDIGLLVEYCFCGPRDIEWAISQNCLFLLQARPVTALYAETEFELIHEQDCAQRSVDEYWTTANTGEVFPGSVSPLSISLIVLGLDVYGQRNIVVNNKQDGYAFVPYTAHWLPTTHKQVSLSIIDTLFRTNSKTVTATQKSFEVGLFGRVVGTEDMHKVGVKRFGYTPRNQRLLGIFTLIYYFFRAPSLIKMTAKQVESFKIPVEKFTTSVEMYKEISKQMNFYGELSGLHGLATFWSSFFNVFMLNALARGKPEWDNELYCDFATLLSSCSEVESADVPYSLQELAKAIAETDAITFSSVPVEVKNSNTRVLIVTRGPAGEKFKEFLKKHGHRCVKEFDMHSVSWEMQPTDLVKILQTMVKTPKNLYVKSKEITSVDIAVQKLKTPMKTISKHLLKFILPHSRKAVGLREQTKSLVIRIVNELRKASYHLGHLLVQEGMLPDNELIFFLTFDEIKLLTEGRNLFLVSKAVRRRRLHPKLNSLRFPEIIVGIPKPILEETEDVSKYKSSFVLKGTPVCQGVVKAVARVVTTLDKASSIQSGDILVTHSTDIGWSPYFPLLSGVITILGGLISHGAVVAREYGLPCVVGVQRATSLLKSGDVIILDGTKGTITKINEDQTATM